MHALAASTILFASAALAARHEVQVGPGLIFDPDSISDVAEGDTIDVIFGAGHDIVQSSFSEPCVPLENAVYSGPSPADGDVFSFDIVNASAPLWFYCSISSHCQAGMVLAINPSSEETLEAYTQAAAQVSQAEAPEGSEPVGGTIGDEASVSETASETTAMETATETGATATTSETSTVTGAAPTGAATTTAASAAGNLKATAGLLAGLLAGGAALVL